MHRIDRNDRVRLLALTWADSLPAAAVSNWEANVRSSEKLDRVVSAVIQRNEYGSHGDFEKAYLFLEPRLRDAVRVAYVECSGPRSERSEEGIHQIAIRMPRDIRLPREVLENAQVLMSRVVQPKRVLRRDLVRSLLDLGGHKPHESDPLPPQSRWTKGRSREAKLSFIYFAERDGFIKIGRSTQVVERVKGLRATLLGTVPDTGNERAIHERFNHLRADVPFASHTEWFTDGPEIRDYISSNCETAGG